MLWRGQLDMPPEVEPEYLSWICTMQAWEHYKVWWTDLLRTPCISLFLCHVVMGDNNLISTYMYIVLVHVYISSDNGNKKTHDCVTATLLMDRNVGVNCLRLFNFQYAFLLKNYFQNNSTNKVHQYFKYFATMASLACHLI